MDLINELQQKDKHLTACIKELRTSGTSLAESERDYKIKLREEVLKLKKENTAATLINLIIYGVQEVADLRFKRDISETIYKANLEAINSTKLQMRIIENQIAREWGSPNNV